QGNLWMLHGDCLEKMREIPDNSVDLILTDPPYGTVGTLTSHSFQGRVGWDKPIDTRQMMTECYRVLRPKGTLCLFSQDPYTYEIIGNTHGNLPFSYRYTWLKGHFGNPLIASVAPVNITEDVCVFFKCDIDHRTHPLQQKLKDELDRLGISSRQLGTMMNDTGIIHSFTSGKVFRFPSRERFERVRDVTGGFVGWNYDMFKMVDDSYKEYRKFEHPKVFNLPEGEKKKPNVLSFNKDSDSWHPTQKPVALLEDLINTYTNPGDMVLDFTMGSGSTGVAAMNTGRKFTGIELSSEYYDKAVKRVLTVLSNH
ncbi:MAG: DNA-methyltransferase, partial [Plesiomonas sp.]